MDIDNWLDRFEKGWEKKNIDLVLGLFTEDVEYHETPDRELETIEEIRNEWEGIEQQENIQIDTALFAKENEKFAVKWDLSYVKDGINHDLKGVYLIKLNSENKCYEFWQYIS